MKKKLLSLALMTVFVSLMALGTAAYFNAEGRATNVITTGAVNIKLVEKQMVQDANGEWTEIDYPESTITGVMPGMPVSKIPYVVPDEEKGTAPFYTRVKAVVEVERNGEIDPDGNQYISLNYDTDNWVQGEDGWWYYEGVVSEGKRVALFSEVMFSPDMPNEYQDCKVEVEVFAQAVQAKNNEPKKGADGLVDYTTVTGWPKEAE